MNKKGYTHLGGVHYAKKNKAGNFVIFSDTFHKPRFTLKKDTAKKLASFIEEGLKVSSPARKHRKAKDWSMEEARSNWTMEQYLEYQKTLDRDTEMQRDLRD